MVLEELELDGTDHRDLHWADGIPARTGTPSTCW